VGTRPVSTAACLPLCAAIPNFLILEYVRTNEPWRTRVQKGEPIANRNGYLPLPEAPGLGIDLDEEVIASRPFEPFDVYRRFDEDGAVADVRPPRAGQIPRTRTPARLPGPGVPLFRCLSAFSALSAVNLLEAGDGIRTHDIQLGKLTFCP
jgi:hypothetical protein